MVAKSLLVLAVIACVSALTLSADVPPVVIMHGITGSAVNFEPVANWIRQALPGVYVKNMEIGNGVESSIFMDMNKQVDEFCENIYADPNLERGFNLIGFSQGGLISRGYVQRCNKFPVINFLSWCSPQAGVFGLQPLGLLNRLVGDVPYAWWAQKTFTFAQYWRDPYRLTDFYLKSTYLADLNNVRLKKNPTYVDNIKSLKSWMLLYSDNDDVLSPAISGWFGFYAPYSGPGPLSRIVPLEDSLLYKQDWIGIRALNEDGRVQFHKSNCTHAEHNSDTCYHAFEMYSLPILAQPWSEVEAFWAEQRSVVNYNM